MYYFGEGIKKRVLDTRKMLEEYIEPTDYLKLLMRSNWLLGLETRRNERLRT